MRVPLGRPLSRQWGIRLWARPHEQDGLAACCGAMPAGALGHGCHEDPCPEPCVAMAYMGGPPLSVSEECVCCSLGLGGPWGRTGCRMSRALGSPLLGLFLGMERIHGVSAQVCIVSAVI